MYCENFFIYLCNYGNRLKCAMEIVLSVLWKMRDCCWLLVYVEVQEETIDEIIDGNQREKNFEGDYWSDWLRKMKKCDNCKYDNIFPIFITTKPRIWKTPSLILSRPSMKAPDE